MKCKVCGRSLSGKSDYCYSCGAQQTRKKFVRFQSFGKTATQEVKVGKKTWHVWSLCLYLAMWTAVLAFAAVAIPKVTDFIGVKKQEIEEAIAPQPVVVEEVSETDAASGVLLRLDLQDANITPVEEHSYSDNTWQCVEKVGDKAVVKLNRFNPSDSWVAQHVLKLYPDVVEVEEYTENLTVCGYDTSRIMISYTEGAPDCAVEVMLIKTKEYDYVVAVEIPMADFGDYEKEIDRWLSSLALYDTSTGLTVYNTVSASDALADTVSDDATLTDAADE